MKHYKIILLAVLSLLAFSCSVEEPITPTEELNLSVQNDTELSNSKSQGTDAAVFENYLEWAGYLSLRLAAENPGHYNQISNAIQLDGTIQLYQLLSESGETTFQAAFEDLMVDILTNDLPDPDTDGAKPPPPNGDPPFGPPTEEEAQQIVDDMIDYLVVDNCVEFYFPNGFGPWNGFTTMTSVAHPMNTDNYNDGIRRHYFPIYNALYPNGTNTDIVTVNQAYVNVSTNFSILIARPVKASTPFDPMCQYNEYSGINFQNWPQ